MRPATVRFSQPNRGASRRRNGFAYTTVVKKTSPAATPVEHSVYHAPTETKVVKAA
ncbi:MULTISPECIES: hypothetical protein [Vibrio]|uniref:Uncharacterized protein n=1 Tax=Vibrio nitrifigilis TaxID=2789781 RepID=A0ABS0GFQ0_9VIBR|nr:MULTISPECIES: hypothetical protein [Vibrio]MBF9001073.1 hypothetical protein [Vibrio nitrifigilis]